MNRFLTVILFLVVMPVVGFGDTNALIVTNIFSGVNPLVFKGLVNSRTVDGLTNSPPSEVTTFAGNPNNKNAKITLTIGSRISLQGKEHLGYLNWLVVKGPDSNEVRALLLDDVAKGNHARLTQDELKELDVWLRKDGTEWTGSYANTPIFRKLVLPGWGGLESHEEWQKGYIRFRPLPQVWVVSCDHPQTAVNGPGSYLIASTTYFDEVGNILCSIPHELFVD